MTNNVTKMVQESRTQLMNFTRFENGILYNGNCTEVMTHLIDEGINVNVVLTSPPYNTQRNLSDRSYDKYLDSICNNEYLSFLKSTFDQYHELLDENGVILYNISYGNENPTVFFQTLFMILQDTEFMVADIITWKKRNAMPNNVSHNKLTRICEYVFVICRKSEYKTYQCNKQVTSVRKTGQKMYQSVPNYIEARNNDGSNPLNKCTFSSDLVEQLLTLYAKDDSVVLDNFNGTGTTSLGASRNGNYFIGIELSQAQHEYAIERLKEVGVV